MAALRQSKRWPARKASAATFRRAAEEELADARRRRCTTSIASAQLSPKRGGTRASAGSFFSRATECRRACFRAGHRLLCRISPPWFVSDAAEREPDVPDRTALDSKRRCDAHEGKGVARAVANLPVPGVPCESQWSK